MKTKIKEEKVLNFTHLREKRSFVTMFLFLPLLTKKCFYMCVFFTECRKQCYIGFIKSINTFPCQCHMLTV